MQAQPRRDTKCEMTVRSAVHALGLRYRVHQRPEPDLRREADLVFRRDKVAVFVDGCFWHGCPAHYVAPRSRTGFWSGKLSENVMRDRRQTAEAEAEGWRFRVGPCSPVGGTVMVAVVVAGAAGAVTDWDRKSFVPSTWEHQTATWVAK